MNGTRTAARAARETAAAAPGAARGKRSGILRVRTAIPRARTAARRLVFVCVASTIAGWPVVATAQSAPPGERVYVANQSSATVSVIDAASGEVVHTIDVTEFGFDPNSRPHHTAVEPDGSHWYVSLIGGGHVLRFNADNELVGRAPFETPGLLVVDPASPG